MKTTAYAILVFFLLLVHAQADSPIHVQVTTVDMPTSDAARLKSMLVSGAHTHDDLTALQRAAAVLGISVRPVPGLEVTTLDGVTGSADAHYWVPRLEPSVRLDHNDNRRNTLEFGPDMTAFPWINLDGTLDVRIHYSDKPRPLLPRPCLLMESM